MKKSKFQRDFEDNQKVLLDAYKKYADEHPLELEESKWWKR